MFHPNVYANGELCLDILQNRWSPTYDVAAILTSIQSLLHDPNPNSPANAEAAQLYRENMKEYVRRVKATVEESWLDPDEKVDLNEGQVADGGTQWATKGLEARFLVCLQYYARGWRQIDFYTALYPCIHLYSYHPYIYHNVFACIFRSAY